MRGEVEGRRTDRLNWSCGSLGEARGTELRVGRRTVRFYEHGGVKMRRVVDIIFGASCLVTLSPILAGIAAAVRLDSPGPAIFTQTRVGYGGELFEMHKFRTMQQGALGPSISPAGDPRVTRVGRVLRATKLDELPQFYDVLRGKMTLVGPRPEVDHYMRYHSPEDRRCILSVRPGLTDPATLLYVNESDELACADEPERHYVESILPRKAEIYVRYIREQSPRRDMWILARTALTMARRSVGVLRQGSEQGGRRES